MKYSFMDMLRSKWSIIYVIFFLMTTFFLLYFSNNLSKAIISLMNVVLTIVPLISVMMGVTYYYNSLEFAELLLAQPLKRSSVFLGQFLGLSLSLSLSYIIGLGIPFLIYGIHNSGEITDFIMVLISGSFLTFIFTGIAYFSTMINDDKIRGFGLAIMIWLFMAVLYDGIFLLILIYYKEYPLEKLAIFLSVLNPIDFVLVYDNAPASGTNVSPARTYFYNIGSQVPVGWYLNGAFGATVNNDTIPAGGAFIVRKANGAAGTVKWSPVVPYASQL